MDQCCNPECKELRKELERSVYVASYPGLPSRLRNLKSCEGRPGTTAGYEATVRMHDVMCISYTNPQQQMALSGTHVAS